MINKEETFIWYRNIEENKSRIAKIRHNKNFGIKAGSISLYEFCTTPTGDMATDNKRVKILAEYCDDNEFSPKALPYRCGDKVHWKCMDCGYEWITAVSSRTGHNRGCANCAGQVVNEDNSLAKWCAENGLYGQQILSEYMDKNEKDPTKIAAHCNKKVWWKCSRCLQRKLLFFCFKIILTALQVIQ